MDLSALNVHVKPIVNSDSHPIFMLSLTLKTRLAH